MPVSVEEAQRIVSLAHKKAKELGVEIAAAVVDEGGFLVALGRTNGATPLSGPTAEAKAASAAMLHRDGGQLAMLAEKRPAVFDALGKLARLPLVPVAGSFPLEVEGRIVGAVGVSGGLAEQDAECAAAGRDGVLGEAR